MVSSRQHPNVERAIEISLQQITRTSAISPGKQIWNNFDAAALQEVAVFVRDYERTRERRSCLLDFAFFWHEEDLLDMKALKQVGALCVCEDEDDNLLVLLVTSRETGRWIIPKGWLAKRLKAHEAAAREAMEEGGVTGKIGTKPIGTYRYFRSHTHGQQLHIVSVYLFSVRSALEHWPEEAQRKRAWFPASAAARLVAEPELRSLIARVGHAKVRPKLRGISRLAKSAEVLVAR